MQQLESFLGFSDIVFNPNRSLNCQARAAALFVSLSKNGLIDEQIFSDKDYYFELMTDKKRFSSTEPIPRQLNFPFLNESRLKLIVDKNNAQLRTRHSLPRQHTDR